MPLRHYLGLVHTLRTSKLLKLQVFVLFLTTYIDWTLMPFITKLEGMHLPVFIISFYMLLGASDGLVLPLFQNIKIYRIYFFVIVLDLIQIATYALASVDIVLFTYVILTVFTVQAITFEISRVHTVDFMKEEVEIKEYLMLRSFIVSIAIILGAVTAMVLDGLGVSLEGALYMLGVLGLIAVIIEYRLYAKFKKIVQNEATIIVGQNSFLGDKIKLKERN